MKATILAFAAGLTIAAAAAAQMPPPDQGPGWQGGSPPGPPPGPGYGQGGGGGGGDFWGGAPDSPRERIQFLQDRINRGVADGSLERRKAKHATRELDGVRHWIRQMHYDHGGPLSPEQRDQVQGRLDQISHELHWMRHNG